MTIRLDPDRDALAIIDCQPAFMPGGALPTPHGDAVIPVINRLMHLPFGYRFATQDWHPKGHISFASSHPSIKAFDQLVLPEGPLTVWPDHALKGTDEASLHPALDTRLVDLVIRKGALAGMDGLSAFSDRGRRYRTGLASLLRERGVERLFVVGLALDVCVEATATDAVFEGFSTFIVEDACKPSKPERLQVTQSRLENAQVQFVRESDLL